MLVWLLLFVLLPIVVVLWYLRHRSRTSHSWAMSLLHRSLRHCRAELRTPVSHLRLSLHAAPRRPSAGVGIPAPQSRLPPQLAAPSPPTTGRPTLGLAPAGRSRPGRAGRASGLVPRP